MRPRRRSTRRTGPALLVGFMLAGLALGTAQATKLSVTTGTCPLGGEPVKIYQKIAANTHGGFDSDLASYASGGQFRAYEISTCTDHLLTLYGRDMLTPIPAAQKPALETAVMEARTGLSDAISPPVWERYALAVQAYRALGRSEFFVADLFLAASWTARDEAVGEYLGLRGPTQVLEILTQGRAELTKELTPANRKTVLYNLARVAHRGGHNLARDEFLAGFAEVGDLDRQETEALARFRRMATEIEPRYQDLAIEALTNGLRATDLTLADKIPATYVLADLLRRRDRPSDALPLYTLVFNEATAPPELREMAVVLARHLVDSGAVTPPSPIQ